MGRPKKKIPIFPDAPWQVGLQQAADLAPMPRTVAYRALRTRDIEHPLGVYAAHHVPGLKQPYFTHPDSIYAAPEAWKTYVREIHVKQLRTDPTSSESR